MITDTLSVLMKKDFKEKLTLDELACAMYEGTQHVNNLAEKCARNYGQAEALSFYDMMGDDVRNFWRGIAKQVMDHSTHWLKNQGSACVLDEEEQERLRQAPRVQEPTS